MVRLLRPGGELFVQTDVADRGERYEEVVSAQVDALVRLVEDTDVTRDLSDERFRVGVDDYLSVLDSQQLYYDARQQLIQANLVRNLNVISVYRALGAWPERQPAADTPPES